MKARQVRKCRVQMAFNIGCPKLTYNLYCKEHKKLLALECGKYHLMKYSEEYSKDIDFVQQIGNINAVENLLALVEMEQRIAFRIKYNIVSDRGHRRWEEQLGQLAEDVGIFVNRGNYIMTYEDAMEIEEEENNDRDFEMAEEMDYEREEEQLEPLEQLEVEEGEEEMWD